MKMECHHVTDCGKYRIETLTASTFPGALKVLREAFCVDEAVCIGCELDKNPKAIEELLDIAVDAALDGVSLVAVTIDTEEVVAVAFNKLLVPNPKEKPFFETFAENCTQDSCRSIVQFYDDLDQRCNLFEEYGIDCSFEIMYVSTLREHRKHKLAWLLCKISIDVAKRLKNGAVPKINPQDLGPKYSTWKPHSIEQKIPKICQAVWSSRPTQSIGKSLNFTVHLRVPYTHFVFNGKTYAERIGAESPFYELAVLVLEPPV